MTEVLSKWILQEVFVDPSLETIAECTLNLSVASEVLEREGNRYKVSVELSGSVVGEEFQIANIRFVNVSVVEVKPGTRKTTVLKKLEKAKEGELLSILPIYLLKAGIFLKEVYREL